MKRKKLSKALETAISGLDGPRHAQVADRLSQTPTSAQGAYLRAVLRKSRPAAVKAFCLECTGWDRASVTDCTARACPLWPWRPYQKKS